MPASTKLWAGSVGLREETAKGRIWRSDDAGETWWYVSECARAKQPVCLNFHPADVASLDGKSLIGFASDYTPNGKCFTSWGTSSLPPFPG
ncbi:hypothetical protein [Lentzea roselyniae]|uniref:hypothetical protein n=1 Tax=Lentzea roselyniae TaxID=531940 RepID=UPI0031F7702A